MDATEILRALRADGFTLTAEGDREPAAALSAGDRVALSTWLDRIGETDPKLRAALLQQCARDPQARAYFLAHAAKREA